MRGPVFSKVRTIGSNRARSKRSMVRAAFSSVPPMRIVEMQCATRMTASGRLATELADKRQEPRSIALYPAASSVCIDVATGALTRVATSPASAAEDDHRDGEQHDSQVLDERLPPQVLQIVADFHAHVID